MTNYIFWIGDQQQPEITFQKKNQKKKTRQSRDRLNILDISNKICILLNRCRFCIRNWAKYCACFFFMIEKLSLGLCCSPKKGKFKWGHTPYLLYQFAPPQLLSSCHSPSHIHLCIIADNSCGRPHFFLLFSPSSAF